VGTAVVNVVEVFVKGNAQRSQKTSIHFPPAFPPFVQAVLILCIDVTGVVGHANGFNTIGWSVGLFLMYCCPAIQSHSIKHGFDPSIKQARKIQIFLEN